MAVHDSWVPAIGQLVEGRYRIVELVGKGPAGLMYGAVDEATAAEVAFKAIHPKLFEGKARSVNMARLRRADACRHEGLVPIRSLLLPAGEGQPAFVVEDRLAWPTLREALRMRLEHDEPLRPAEIAWLLDRMGAVVGWLHTNGAIHGNLKPENVFLAGDHVILSDPYFLAGRTQLHWLSGELPLRDHYLAPEQILRGTEESAQIDIFAFGMILGEVVVGEPVRDGIPLSRRHEGVSEALDDLFMRATSQDPLNRHPSLAAFLAEVHSVLAVEPEPILVDASDTQIVSLGEIFEEDELPAIVAESEAAAAQAGDAAGDAESPTVVEVAADEERPGDAYADEDEFDRTLIEEPSPELLRDIAAEAAAVAASTQGSPPSADHRPPSLRARAATDILHAVPAGAAGAPAGSEDTSQGSRLAPEVGGEAPATRPAEPSPRPIAEPTAPEPVAPAAAAPVPSAESPVEAPVEVPSVPAEVLAQEEALILGGDAGAAPAPTAPSQPSAEPNAVAAMPPVAAAPAAGAAPGAAAPSQPSNESEAVAAMPPVTAAPAVESAAATPVVPSEVGPTAVPSGGAAEPAPGILEPGQAPRPAQPAPRSAVPWVFASFIIGVSVVVAAWILSNTRQEPARPASKPAPVAVDRARPKPTSPKVPPKKAAKPARAVAAKGPQQPEAPTGAPDATGGSPGSAQRIAAALPKQRVAELAASALLPRRAMASALSAAGKAAAGAEASTEAAPPAEGAHARSPKPRVATSVAPGAASAAGAPGAPRAGKNAAGSKGTPASAKPHRKAARSVPPPKAPAPAARRHPSRVSAAEKKPSVPELLARVEAQRKATPSMADRVRRSPRRGHPVRSGGPATTPPPATHHASALPVSSLPGSSTRKGCPPGMVLVERKKTRTIAGRKVIVRRSWCIDRYEYPGKGRVPRTNVTWFEATRLCARAGKRLCAKDEWTFACGAGAKYPYGSQYDPKRCNTAGPGGDGRPLALAGSHRGCRSPYGLYDMSGNASEWTAEGTVNGGNSHKDAETATCYRAPHRAKTSTDAFVGFRCCADPL